MGMVRRIRNLWRRELVSAEIEAELRSHIEMAVEDGIRAGMSEEEAGQAARLRFGNPVVVRERAMSSDAALGLDGIYTDFRYAVRTLHRAPAFALTAILTLTLGIGASTAIFSLVQAFLLRPLPYPQPSQLVVVWERLRTLGIDRFPAPIGDFVDYRNDNRVFSDMAAVENTHFVLSGHDYPERIFALRATANLFPMMGLRAALGRTLVSSDSQPGHEHVAVLSDALWRERFGGDAKIVGEKVVLNGQNYEIVGVLSRGVRFSVGYPRAAALWVPLTLVADAARRTGQLEMLARMRDGVTLQQAQANMDSVAAQLEREYHIERGPHGEDPGYGVRLIPLHEELTGNLRQPLLLMLGATLLIFLIACANIANLMLTHGVSRAREFAIRISLGAPRARLMRLLMTEALVMALLGEVAGAGVAAASSTLLVRLSPYQLASLFGPSIDVQVLSYAAILAIAAVLIFGLTPAMLVLRRGKSELLALTAHQVLGERRGRRMSKVLVIAEMALSVALTIGAGMLIHSFIRLQEVPLGFEMKHKLTATVNLPPSYSNGNLQRAFFGRLLERLRSTPGIKDAAATTMLPAVDRPLHDPFSLEGRQWQPYGNEQVPQFMNHQAVSTDYFQTMGIRLRKGRVFTADDKEGSLPVAVVNETMVRGFWPGENPIGKHLMAGAPRPGAPWLTIVGVVADVKSGGATANSLPELYTPMAQTPAVAMSLVVRTKRSNAARAAGELRAALASLDSTIPLTGVATYDELLAGQLGPRRYEMFLLTAFGSLALMLAAVGLYGVVSYAVTERANEIGLRMAFGATARNVMGMVIRQALMLTVGGLGLGVVLALLFRQVLTSVVFGIRLVDFPVYAGATLLLVCVSLLAAAIPAWRAASIDPMQALRTD